MNYTFDQYSSLINAGVQLSKSPAIQNFSKFAARITNILEPFARESGYDSFTQLCGDLARMEQKTSTLNANGWIPHPTIPLDLLPESPENEYETSENIISYFDAHWDEVQNIFIGNLDTYKADDCTKDILLQILHAHGQRHYHLVVCGVFPEMERITREALKLTPTKSLSKQKELCKRILEIPLHEIPASWHFVLRLINHLEGHLYKNINNINSLKSLEENKIPNRHASMHGMVMYNSVQSSLNAIFLLDYMLAFVGIIKDIDSKDK